MLQTWPPFFCTFDVFVYKYKRILNSVVSSFIDSGDYSMARLSPSIEQRKQVYNCEANDVSVV